MSDFSNYQSGEALYGLADNLLPEIADSIGFSLAERPEVSNISELISVVGPDKELQKNISVVREVLGEDAKDQIADWIERSGIMYPVERGLVSPVAVPDSVDTVIINGGVANWMLRRTAVVQRLDPEKVGQVVLPIGNRTMANVEHQLVASYEKKFGQRPTESQFAERYLLGSLALMGFDAQLIAVESGRGNEVLDALVATNPSTLDGTVVVASNAPNAIQAAGELRLAGQRSRANFDSAGEQVFMVSDSFPVARHGEAAKTHQNPETALGQLFRNAYFLVKNGVVI